MAKIELHPDFRDFLRLLNSRSVEYLVVGGYAVGYYGYPRATGDLDIWIAVGEVNAEKISQALVEFGMPEKQVSRDLFTGPRKMVRMGLPPVQIEILTSASGVEFEACYSRRQVVEVDDISMNLISLPDLKINKKAAGRHKDLEDFEHLP